MPRPFPFPINIGNDICRISRIREILGHQTGVGHGRRFVDRIFTEDEKRQLQVPPFPDLLTQLSRWDELVRQRKALDLRTSEVLAARKKKKQPSVLEAAEQAALDRDASIAQHLARQLAKVEKTASAGLDRYAEFVAGRFAAKEATIKAYQSPQRKLTYRDVAILKQDRRPDGRLQGPMALVKKEDSKGWDDAQVVKISISHDSEYATAVCLACPEYEEKAEEAPPATTSAPASAPPLPPLPTSRYEQAPRSWVAQKNQMVMEVWNVLKSNAIQDMKADQARAMLLLLKKQAEAIDKRLNDLSVPRQPREFMATEEEIDVQARKEVLRAIRHSVARLYPGRYVFTAEPGKPFPPKDAVIFVGNLSSHVEERHLLFVFHGLSPFVKAMVARNPNGTSRKWGSVVMASDTDAKRAIRLVNGWPIHGHAIKCGISKLSPRMRERFLKEVAYESQENPLLDGFVGDGPFTTNAQSLLAAAESELLDPAERTRSEVGEDYETYQKRYARYRPGIYEQNLRAQGGPGREPSSADADELQDEDVEHEQTGGLSDSSFHTQARDLLEADAEEEGESGRVAYGETQDPSDPSFHTNARDLLQAEAEEQDARTETAAAPDVHDPSGKDGRD
ncbi:holo-acyl-carrier-protein synthase [Phlyctema vagabunda]|uniref:Holo-acyl-carrier-protein synthase n=1 Tax=Phlyctema vagabunda TaxID=108571 RepID=A0ABR4PVJ5_9HELO